MNVGQFIMNICLFLDFEQIDVEYAVRKSSGIIFSFFFQPIVVRTILNGADRFFKWQKSVLVNSIVQDKQASI